VTEILKLNWVYASNKGKEKAGFQDLIVALASAPHESLFSTELIITLVEHFWDYFYKRIFFLCFCPYVVYFCTTIYYVSTYPSLGILEEERWAPTAEFFLRWIILACVIYFASFEIVSIARDGFSYFTDIYNYFDWVAFTLNFYVVFSVIFENRSEEEELSEEELLASRTTLNSLSALLAFLMWVKSFYWMRLFSSTSFYIRLIQETLYDIRYFMILFVFILMTFGNALMIMAQNHPANPETPIYKNIFGAKFINIIMDQYMLALGEFSLDGY